MSRYRESKGSMNKVFPDATMALNGLLRDGMTIAAGGFGLCGIPELLIEALMASGAKDLTLISNDGGTDDFGLGPLLRMGRIKTLVASYIGSNPALAELYIQGKVQIQLVPQGTLAEQMRAGGAGIPAFYTATGVGTIVAEGKELKTFDGRDYLMERSITTDLAFVKAWKADPSGNLIFPRPRATSMPLPQHVAASVWRKWKRSCRLARWTRIISICPASMCTGSFKGSMKNASNNRRQGQDHCDARGCRSPVSAKC